MASLKDRIHELIGFVQSGRIMDAMDEFYHDSVQMQENAKPPTTGLAANKEREAAFLEQVKDFHRFEATGIGVDESAPGTGVVLLENVLEFTNQQDQRVTLEQVSVQRWRDGKIEHERFYFDTGS